MAKLKYLARSACLVALVFIVAACDSHYNLTDTSKVSRTITNAKGAVTHTVTISSTVETMDPDEVSNANDFATAVITKVSIYDANKKGTIEVPSIVSTVGLAAEKLESEFYKKHNAQVQREITDELVKAGVSAQAAAYAAEQLTAQHILDVKELVLQEDKSLQGYHYSAYHAALADVAALQQQQTMDNAIVHDVYR